MAPYNLPMKPAPSSAVVMEAADYSETSVPFYQATWHCNPQHNYIHTHGQDNLKSHFKNLVAAPQKNIVSGT
jgi:hypothetical protein